MSHFTILGVSWCVSADGATELSIAGIGFFLAGFLLGYFPRR